MRGYLVDVARGKRGSRSRGVELLINLLFGDCVTLRRLCSRQGDTAQDNALTSEMKREQDKLADNSGTSSNVVRRNYRS